MYMGVQASTLASLSRGRTSFGHEQRVLWSISRRPTAMKAGCSRNARIVASPCIHFTAHQYRSSIQLALPPRHDTMR